MAGRTPRRIDGVPEFAKAIDVVADGAAADLEPLGEFGPRPRGARLEEGQQGEESCGCVEHVQILLGIRNQTFL
jgi:hypothetical protein